MSQTSEPVRRTRGSGHGAGDPALAAALEAASATYGVSPIDEPRRASAIVADLIGDPSTSSAGSIIALRAALTELATRSGGRSKVDHDEVIASITELGVSRTDAERALDTVLEVLGVGPVDSPMFGRRWLLAAPLAAAITIALGIALWPDDGSDGLVAVTTLDDSPVPTTESATTPSSTPAVETTTTAISEDPTSSETTTTSTPTTTTAELDGLSATFQAVREGAFTVERGWRVTQGQRELIGVVRLTAPDGQTATGLHRELAPAAVGDGTAVSWTPEPAQRVNRVASFAGITLEPGEVLEIEFRSPIDPAAPLTEADLLDWFEAWRPDAETIRSALGESDELLEPVVTVES